MIRKNPKWVQILTIIVKYKFGNEGTAESTTDEIYNLFIENGLSTKEVINSPPNNPTISKDTAVSLSESGGRDSVTKAEDIHSENKRLLDKDYAKDGGGEGK